MKMRLISLLLGLLACLPTAHSASRGVQARFEQSLNEAKSLVNVEIKILDTLSIKDPEALQRMKISKEEFSRTVQYSYTASGMKYRATSKLISGTETNLRMQLTSVFNGTSYSTYDGDSRYMTRGSDPPLGGGGETSLNPLIAPFLFLTSNSDDCRPCMLRFTDVISPEFANGLIVPAGQRSNGWFEISMPGHPLGKQPTAWKITIDEASDAFTPRMITQIAPGDGTEEVWKLLNYTNLGPYQFPTRIECAVSVYPPTSPPTLRLTDTVTMISVRIPDQIADSVFKLEDEEKSAATVWNWDQKAFTKSSNENSKSKASLRTQPNIYDESADGSKQISEALVMAKKENKHILLQFGANWCSWCHKLHKLFDSDNRIAGELKSSYVVVLIDVNKEHNKDIDTKYGNPTRFGLPVIVILDADGKQLTTQDTGKLEEGDHHDPEKVAAFLREWSPKQ
jgi:thiol-disulfide isomerase/thioredoxin